MKSSSSSIKFLNRNRPCFDLATAADLARSWFGLSGEVAPLYSERDQNFSVRGGGGSSVVLKIANVDEDPGVVDFQLQALCHIEAQDPHCPVPRVVPTRAGEPTGWVQGSDGRRHLVYALSYLPGTLLGEAAKTPALLRAVGAGLARLDLALRGFFHPHARHELLWDLTRAEALRPHAAQVADAVARRNVEAIIDHHIEHVMPRLSRLRHQVIHNDAHGENLLVDSAQPERLAGILDFGDMVHAPLVMEIAVAAEAMGPDHTDPVAAVAELAAGYDAHLPLEEEEVDLVYDLALARYATTAAIIAWRKAETPDQPGYLREFEQPCWRIMEMFLQAGRGPASNRIRHACRFPPYCPAPGEAAPEAIASMLERRHRLLGESLHLFYDSPVHVERGRGAWLFGPDGKFYLDAYNNVPQVGHAHPHVVKAIARQAAALNTNTRYLYRPILDYAERLTAVMPEGLSACIFVNSGSEANDIAWRMAQLITGARGALVMDQAYHGITEAVTALSPAGSHAPLAAHVRTLMVPDVYRGPYREGEPADLACHYAADADRAITDLAAAGHAPAAFMVDTTLCSSGIIDAPPGYFSAVAERVRAAGGLVIADEVQAGFGRSGSHLWGHEAHGLKADIVTLGKPVGNGYPLGVVVTTPEILDRFGRATGMFSTFGGNPVACAAGLAVLDVIEREDLIAGAGAVGAALRAGLRALMQRHGWIGDVRGRGLLAGVEIVRERSSQEPAPAETRMLLNRMRDNGVLIGSEGRHGNILKIRPPLVFGHEHAERLIEALDRSLASL